MMRFKDGHIVVDEPTDLPEGMELTVAVLDADEEMTTLYKPLAKAVTAAGVTPISLHSLRRTWENLLRAAGVDQMVRRAMAGWRSEQAQRIYATVDRTEREAAAQALVDFVEVAAAGLADKNK